MDLELMCQNTFAHQRELIDEAARRRLRSSITPRQSNGRPRWRTSVALALRRLADRLEPQPVGGQLGLLRAVAHREIDVDQALALLRRPGRVRI